MGRRPSTLILRAQLPHPGLAMLAVLVALLPVTVEAASAGDVKPLPAPKTERLLDAIEGIPDLQVIATAQFPPDSGCPDMRGLFTLRPDELQIHLPRGAAELPFAVSAARSPEQRSIVFVFAAPTCRVTMRIEKEIRDASGQWTPVPLR